MNAVVEETHLPWFAASPVDQLQTVRDTSLAKLVRDEVLTLVLQGVYQPGQRINEPDVAKRLGVSRVPVREALRELESSGMVVSKKHSGVFVRQLAAHEIQDLYRMRALLDGYVGRLAAQLPSAQRVKLAAHLQTLLADMRTAMAAHDVQAYYRKNLEFHWAIVQASGNNYLIASYQSIVNQLHLSRLKNLSHDVGMNASIQEHAHIVQSIEAGQSQTSEALMARHVEDALQRLFAQHPDFQTLA